MYGDHTLLTAAWDALVRPAFSLSYGRREYPIVLPLRLHFDTGSSSDLTRLMREWPWLAPPWARPSLGRDVTLRLYETRHPRVARSGLRAYAPTPGQHSDATGSIERPPVEVTNPDGNPGLDPIDWFLSVVE